MEEPAGDETTEGLIQDCKGPVLASQYSIIKLILAHLPMHQLKQCKQVCQNWKDVANIICRERERFPPKSFYWEGIKENYSKKDSKYPWDYKHPEFFDTPSHKKGGYTLLDFRHFSPFTNIS
ncbi:uncharacterized protein LOC111715321 [Eurytemora carolleeae]|uniref:uncharacterized protein LOC111715321 n=1 Tax=Eurytemora carolleeae TaxID=1294199 RepID=UPI000C76FFB9|nr:uncharacterized protein LOC111715321 [Eurytemora carolleeae]XP_023346408.1 uncharacterized protein LOC111715321 [Eurytemora carolleeae]|eukprot:XP_023346407.1 uncharacterized protein LOC111715321 [Eurytemora affinis]